MSLMGNLENMAMSRVTGSNPSASAVLQLIQNHPGGLQGLVQSFHDNGLGSAVNSWVGTGQNQSVSAEQVQQVLGSEKIQAFAQQLGISPGAAGSTLAQMLPAIVNHLTPNGAVPESSNLLQLGESLLASFEKTGTNG